MSARTSEETTNTGVLQWIQRCSKEINNYEEGFWWASCYLCAKTADLTHWYSDLAVWLWSHGIVLTTISG